MKINYQSLEKKINIKFKNKNLLFNHLHIKVLIQIKIMKKLNF
jgi:hypothetical protein